MMLKEFNIIFLKGQSTIARIIKRLTNSEYSHTALVIDALHLLQLDWKTPVSIQHFAYPLGQYDVYKFKVDLTEDEKRKIILFMRDRLSTTYDWKLIISRFFSIIIGTPIVNSKDKYNCDELIVDAFRHVGINLIEGDIKMTPDTLSKSNLIFKVIEKEYI